MPDPKVKLTVVLRNEDGSLKTLEGVLSPLKAMSRRDWAERQPNLVSCREVPA